LTSVPGAAASPPSSHGFLTSLIGVIRRPRATFRAVTAAPRWVGVMVALTVAAAASQALWLTTERGQLALVDQWERTALAFGQDVDDARYEQFHAFSRNGAFYGVASAVLGGPVLTIAVAAVVFLLFRPVTAEAVSFIQVLSVVVYASVILTLRQVIAAPISFANESTTSATSLGGWFRTMDEASPVARFFGAIDLFVVWWVVVLAVGVAVLYRRQARTVTALLLAVAMTVLGGTA
jgi:Yip1 domain